jgi:hypothetical protein
MKENLEASFWSLATSMSLLSNIGTTASSEFRKALGPILGEYSGDFWIGACTAALAISSQKIGEQLQQEKVFSRISVGIMVLGMILLILNESIGLGGGTPELSDIHAGLLGLLVTLKMFESLAKISHNEVVISRLIFTDRGARAGE